MGRIHDHHRSGSVVILQSNCNATSSTNYPALHAHTYVFYTAALAIQEHLVTFPCLTIHPFCSNMTKESDQAREPEPQG